MTCIDETGSDALYPQSYWLTSARVCAGHINSAAVSIDISHGIEGILKSLGLDAHIPALHKVKNNSQSTYIQLRFILAVCRTGRFCGMA